MLVLSGARVFMWFLGCMGKKRFCRPLFPKGRRLYAVICGKRHPTIQFLIGVLKGLEFFNKCKEFLATVLIYSIDRLD